ncbi:MAG: hypothetical protein R3Y19_02700 [Rikenellaceae bacterium]
MQKINISKAFVDSFAIAVKNIPSIMGSTALWLLTIWVPYINVGTTIAIMSMPIELAKGRVMNPLSIFDSKYRKKMGDYIILMMITSMALFFAMLFAFVPAIVLAISWSMSVYVMIEHDKTPLEALKISNNITYGNKWSIFAVYILVYIAFLILSFILSLIPVIGLLLVLILYVGFMQSVNASIWQQLQSSSEVVE